MQFGGSRSSSSPTLTEEEKASLKATTGFFTGTIAPTYEAIVRGATDIYNQQLPGTFQAAQNLGGTARQVQETLGETGESALRSGISGLQSLFNPDYERQQIMAAMGPAQSQYMTNIANQQAQFGGMGQLGSARQALAERQLAGQTQAAQMATAADIAKGIQGQRAAAAQILAGLGQGGLGQALGAAGTQLTAAGAPLGEFGRYASIPFGTPSGAYTGNFAGTRGQEGSSANVGFKFF